MESRRDLLVELGLDESIVFENPSYDNAMVGYENGTNRIVYNFDNMVEDLMEQDSIEYEESVEFIEYNTLRALPYMGYLAPIVMFPIEDMDYFFGMIEDGNDFIKHTPMLNDYQSAIVGYDAVAGLFRDLPCQGNVRFIVFRHHQQARGVLVDTMHNPRTEHTADTA